uniref:Eukaryotic translation initiation factor 2A n=1 Tax=Canis lupus dingo TaxID=286419 RepID=A0A8C0JV51_CANLU
SAPSTPPLLVHTFRGSEGLYMVNGPPHFTESTLFPRESGKNCKVYTFSKDGTLFAWGNGEKLVFLFFFLVFLYVTYFMCVSSV